MVLPLKFSVGLVAPLLPSPMTTFVLEPTRAGVGNTYRALADRKRAGVGRVAGAVEVSVPVPLLVKLPDNTPERFAPPLPTLTVGLEPKVTAPPIPERVRASA